MNILKKFNKILRDACVYFTASEFFLLLVATGYSEISPESGGGIGFFLSLGSSALIFLACLIMSALNLTFKLDLSMALRLLIHFIGSLIAFGVVFILIPGIWNDFTAIFVRLGVFAVIYLVIAFVVMIVRSIQKNRKTDELEYESQFSEFFNGKNKMGK
jgi:hypothetical protein